MKKGQIFNEVETNRPKSNTFDLSHDRKFSAKMGQLTPVLCMDVIPGDKINIKPAAMVKLAPLIAPVMHRMNVYLHYYYVPNRIIWPTTPSGGFENFITGGEDGLDSTIWSHYPFDPQLAESGDLSDYLGLPIEEDVINGNNETVNISPLPFAAYQKIWNDYYRDQNLQEKALDKVSDGEITAPEWAELKLLKNRAWQHDYFTSALPWTQKGPEAMLPLGTEAPLLYNTFDNARIGAAGTGNALQSNINIQTGPTGLVPNANGDVTIDISDSHIADLSQATAASINDLRRAITLQVWLERNARGGSRYNESIQMHFGVTTDDARLQRPEYIGGMKTPLKVSEVLQTSNNDTQETPQGNMAGHGISVGGGERFSYYAKEHGYIIGLMSVMPETAYQQGIPKHFSRQDKFEYFWPEFAHIGEQAVMNKEIVHTGDPAYNEGIFGYIPRYAEYKFMGNSVHGDYRTNLDIWHLGRKFADQPFLNADFIGMDNAEITRIFAVEQKEQNLWCQVLNDIKATRLMPRFGTPKIQ